MKKSQLRKIIREIIKEQNPSGISTVDGGILPYCVGYDSFIFGATEGLEGFNYYNITSLCEEVTEEQLNQYEGQGDAAATLFCCSLMDTGTPPSEPATLPEPVRPTNVNPKANRASIGRGRGMMREQVGRMQKSANINKSKK